MFKNITKLQERDACLALVFLILVFWFFLRAKVLVYAAMAVLLVGMIWPAAMRPFAWCWFGLSTVLGAVFSKIILGIIWLILVVPVSFARRLMGKDSLKLKCYRKDEASAFTRRNHQYTANDFTNPY